MPGKIVKYSCVDNQNILLTMIINSCRLVGCQTLLEDIPGRKKDNLQLMLSSPGESKSLLRGSKNYRGSTKTYNVKEDLSSKYSRMLMIW